MKKDKFWQLATLLVSSYMMLALLPELRILGYLIFSLGLDTLLLLLGIQLFMIFGGVYQQQILPVAKRVNYFFEKQDPFFFIPSMKQLKKFPQMAVHSIPFLLTGFVFIFSDERFNL